MSGGNTVRIQVDGRELTVRADATLASALMDADVIGFRTSVSGDARAPLCGMGVCYECRVWVDGEAHRRSCMMRVRDGMVVVTGAAHD